MARERTRGSSFTSRPKARSSASARSSARPSSRRSSWSKARSPAASVFPTANLVVLAAAEFFGRVPDPRPAPLAAREKFGAQPRADRFQRAERGRSRRPSRARHRPVSAADAKARAGGGSERSARARVRRGRETLRPARAGLPGFALRRRREKIPPLSSLADAKWARAKKNAAASVFDYAGQDARAPGRARDPARPRLRTGHEMAERVRAFVSVSRNAGPAQSDRRHQGRHGSSRARWIA